MKFNTAIVAAALLAGAAFSAQAQATLVVTQTTAPGFLLSGGTVFSGILTNTGTTPITIDGSGLTAFNKVGSTNVTIPSYDVQGDLNFTDLYNTTTNTFLTLQPKDSHTFDDLFEVNLSGVNNLNYDYVLTSGNTTVAEAFYPKPSAVPEPGSIALLASSVIGGGMFVARRRRK